MKLQTTLRIIFTLLIINSLNAKSEEDYASQIAACNQAVNNAEYDKALIESENVLKKSSHHLEALFCKGRALGALEKFQQAQATLQLATTKAESNFQKIIAHMLLGHAYKEPRQFDEALQQYEAALKASEADKSDKFIRISNHLIGEVHGLNGQHQTALSYHLVGSKLAMNDNERADSYERLSATYKSLNQMDKAIEYQLKAVLMQEKAGTLDQYAESSLVLGQLFTANKEFASAENTYKKLLKFSQDNGGLYYQAKTNLYLAQTKHLQGDDKTANALLLEAKNVADQIKAQDLTQEIAAIKQFE